MVSILVIGGMVGLVAYLVKSDYRVTRNKD